MDDKPIGMQLKLKSLEYTPPKNLTIREMRITHKAAATLVARSAQRVKKMTLFADGLQLKASRVCQEVRDRTSRL